MVVLLLLKVNLEQLKKRAERFGMNVSTISQKVTDWICWFSAQFDKYETRWWFASAQSSTATELEDFWHSRIQDSVQSCKKLILII